MGIRFSCPNGHKLNVKDHLAGKRGVCPSCGAKFVIPAASESQSNAGPSGGDGTASAPAASVAGPAGSPSIVIALADPPAKPATPVEPIVAVAPVLTAAPRAMQATPPAISPAAIFPPPLVVADAERPPPPVAKYVAHRMRSRRLQTTIAIALLIAVVVLGIVLIWVLSRRPEAAGQSQNPSRVRLPSVVDHEPPPLTYALTYSLHA
jgi:hypothetical protein